MTLTDWLQSWITAKAMLVRPRTLTGYRGDKKHIDPLIGSTTLAKLTVKDIERLYRHVLDLGRAPATVIHIRATLTASLGDAVARGRIARNVASLAAAPRDTAGEVQPLNLAEVQMVLNAAAGPATGSGGSWRSRRVCAREKCSACNGRAWIRRPECSRCTAPWPAVDGITAAVRRSSAQRARRSARNGSVGVCWRGR